MQDGPSRIESFHYIWANSQNYISKCANCENELPYSAKWLKHPTNKAFDKSHVYSKSPKVDDAMIEAKIFSRKHLRASITYKITSNWAMSGIPSCCHVCIKCSRGTPAVLVACEVAQTSLVQTSTVLEVCTTSPPVIQRFMTSLVWTASGGVESECGRQK